MTHKILTYAQGAMIGMLLVIGLGVVDANYTPPVSTPPSCPAGSPGCDAPIHVGGSQSKVGSLDITGPASFIRAAVGSFREVRLGSHLNLACDGSTVGHIRYNNATVEYCDGTAWKTFVSGNGTFAASCPDGQVLQAFNGTAPTCVAGNSGGSTNLTNYSQLPTGAIAGYCEDSSDTFAVKVTAPAVATNSGEDCGCASGWSEIRIESNVQKSDELDWWQQTITCIKN